MIGLHTNKRGTRVLTATTYVDVDASVDILPDLFDCIYIKADTPQTAANILLGCSPVLSYKCSYKPLLMCKAMKGKMRLATDLIDEFTDDIDSEAALDAIDRVNAARAEYGIRSETARPVTPNALFANILRFYLSRNRRVIELELLEKSSLGYINPLFEHYHSLGLFHLREMFVFEETMLEYGAFRVYKYLAKQHICPKCNHSHLIYTECCPRCGSSDLKTESIVHHFRCANVSPESAYNQGGMLICPKCHRQLRHIGVDYDRPASIYTCNTCSHAFSVPNTKATCCYCENTVDVQDLIPHDLVHYEITAEGIRALTRGGVNFSQFVNIYDNFIEYANFINRLRRQMTEVYAQGEATLLVGKLWLIGSDGRTTRIVASLQGKLCQQLPLYKVSYNNNVFYAGCLVVGDDADGASATAFRDALTHALEAVSSEIEEGQRIGYTVDKLPTTHMSQLDEFIHDLSLVTFTPDDYRDYDPNAEAEETHDMEPMEALAHTERRTERDRMRKYRYAIRTLVVIALLLLAATLAMLALLV